jgi:hypothetical protein
MPLWDVLRETSLPAWTDDSRCTTVVWDETHAGAWEGTRAAQRRPLAGGADETAWEELARTRGRAAQRYDYNVCVRQRMWALFVRLMLVPQLPSEFFHRTWTQTRSAWELGRVVYGLFVHGYPEPEEWRDDWRNNATSAEYVWMRDNGVTLPFVQRLASALARRIDLGRLAQNVVGGVLDSLRPNADGLVAGFHQRPVGIVGKIVYGAGVAATSTARAIGAWMAENTTEHLLHSPRMAVRSVELAATVLGGYNVSAPLERLRQHYLVDRLRQFRVRGLHADAAYDGPVARMRAHMRTHARGVSPWERERPPFNARHIRDSLRGKRALADVCRLASNWLQAFLDKLDTCREFFSVIFPSIVTRATLRMQGVNETDIPARATVPLRSSTTTLTFVRLTSGGSGSRNGSSAGFLEDLVGVGGGASTATANASDPTSSNDGVSFLVAVQPIVPLATWLDQGKDFVTDQETGLRPLLAEGLVCDYRGAFLCASTFSGSDTVKSIGDAIWWALFWLIAVYVLTEWLVPELQAAQMWLLLPTPYIFMLRAYGWSPRCPVPPSCVFDDIMMWASFILPRTLVWLRTLRLHAKTRKGGLLPSANACGDTVGMVTKWDVLAFLLRTLLLRSMSDWLVYAVQTYAPWVSPRFAAAMVAFAEQALLPITAITGEGVACSLVNWPLAAWAVVMLLGEAVVRPLILVGVPLATFGVILLMLVSLALTYVLLLDVSFSIIRARATAAATAAATTTTTTTTGAPPDKAPV